MLNLPSQKLAVAGTLDPINSNAATKLTAAVDMSKYRQLLAILDLGAIDGTVDFQLQSAATSGGSYTLITGKQITQLSSGNSNKQAIINLRQEELPASQPFVKAQVVCAGATTDLVCIVLVGLEAVQQPVAQPASVVQTIA
jgi:hypothetical protein